MPIENASVISDLNPSWPTGNDPKSGGDDHIRMLKVVMQALYPIGSVVMNTTGANPSTYIGGTWEAYSPGRALVGVGTSDTANAMVWAAGQQSGLETHRLTEAEIPNHVHWIDAPETNTGDAGRHQHAVQTHFNSASVNAENGRVGRAYTSGDNTSTVQTSAVDDHHHSVKIPGFESNGRGGGGAHNNIQPSKAVYIWHRTT